MTDTVSTKQRTSSAGIITGIVIFSVLYIIVFYFMGSIEQKNKDFQLEQFSNMALKLAEEGKIAAENEVSWCLKLNSELKLSKSHKTFLERIIELRRLTGEPLPCVIWDKESKLFYNDHFSMGEESDKNLAFYLEFLQKSFKNRWNISDKATQRLKLGLGPQFSTRSIVSSKQFNNPCFIRTDSAGKFPEFWVNSANGYFAMVFFHRKNRVKDGGLILFREKYRNSDFGIEIISKYDKSVDQKKRFLMNSLDKQRNEGRFSGISGKLMIAGKRLSGMKTLAIYKPYKILVESGKLSLLMAISALFLLIIFLKQAGASYEIANFSIKWQLIVLLFITTGLPLIALGLIASDHLQQKRITLIKNAHQTCIDYVQHIDQRSVILLSSLINATDKGIAAIKKHLPENFCEKIVIDDLKGVMKNSFVDVRLVSSEPAFIATEYGFYKDNKYHFFDKDKNTDKKSLMEAKVFKEVGSYYLSVLNHQPFNMDNLTETELLAEMVYQRPLHEIIQNLMLATDKVLTIGWGVKPYPVLLKLISLKDDGIKDYFFLTLFNEYYMQQNFLLKQLQNIERNPYGLKTLICSSYNLFPSGKKIESDPWLDELFKKTGLHTASEPEFTMHEGKEYVYAGVHARNLNAFYFFAFYPIEKIDKEIAEEKRFLITAGLVALLMLAGLALMFSSGLVTPLSSLQTGAIALQERDFNFRLPPLTRDEFGEMAKIFNSSMADFEELSLASIVQTRLFPQSGIENQNFNIFGKSLPMAELGGDYFDYFQIDEKHYAMLLGDVAGHGVGASIIMAMAKAGIMYSEKSLNDPATLMKGLHELIHATRTKTQRKVMTFQYLYFDSETGNAVYSNAGACSPILIDPKKGTTEEVTLSAPVLGGFKRSRFSNLDLVIKPGQALVFYTDGIVETMNPSGIEIGYEGLKQILLESYDSDAKKFYDNILCKYLDWLGDGSAQDDLTFIILARTDII